ncbi:hypothetical protein [Secundilactobacillus folii]|uniref:Uncharacterized protein n=1 Tax=Secundilactobacillus folii TaxID=2678357 RepID=A0A7X2XWQ2_9LACO|nr:hypothetical protein [Secundilactobacillus folii]MTV83063.1 hypothetical protein [Secundilactobacillus folii]
MLEIIEAFIVHHRRLLQAFLFGMVEMSGLLLYANANSFESYTKPQQLPLMLLAFSTFLLFSCLYIMRTTTATSITAPILLLFTMIIVAVSMFKLPSLVNVINILALVVLCLIRYLPKWFNNELGMALLALMLASLAAGNFLLRHDYLSSVYLTTMILPLLVYLYFFLPPKSYQTRLIPAVVACLTLVWLLYSRRSLTLTVVSLVLLGGWYVIQNIWRPSESRGLLIAALLQACIFIIAR